MHRTQFGKTSIQFLDLDFSNFSSLNILFLSASSWETLDWCLSLSCCTSFSFSSWNENYYSHILCSACFAFSLKVCYENLSVLIRGVWPFVSKRAHGTEVQIRQQFIFSCVDSPKSGRWSRDRGRIFFPEGQPGTFVGERLKKGNLGQAACLNEITSKLLASFLLTSS